MGQFATDIADPDYTNTELGPVCKATPLGMQRKHRQNVLGNTVGVAAGRRREANTRGLEPVEIDMVGTDGGCANKPNPTALQELTIYPGDGTNQDDIGIPDILVRHGTAGYPANLADIAEKGIQ